MEVIVDKVHVYNKESTFQTTISTYTTYTVSSSEKLVGTTHGRCDNVYTCTQ